MAYCFVEFDPYGTIGEFECDGMTEEEINEEATQIFNDFVIGEGFHVTIVDDKKDY